MPWKRKAHWTIGLLMFCGWLAAMCLVFGVPGCHSSTQPAVTAAEIVNEVAHRGDQVFAVSVDSCHAAETVAAELPEVDKATAAVQRIRSACDHAFRGLEQLRTAIATVDALMAKVEAGELQPKAVVAAALDARELFNAVTAEHQMLAEQLQQGP